MTRDVAPGWTREVPLAHRGLHDDEVPENSLAAFDAAAAAGYGIELDARLTVDGRIVVVHDDDLTRLTGSAGSVARMTLADVCARTLGQTDERIPSLVEALEVVAGRVPIMVEVKKQTRHDRGVETAVAKTLHGFPDVERCIASFNPTVLAWFRTHVPHELRVQTIAPVSSRWRRLADSLILRALDSARTRPGGLSIPIGDVGGSIVADTIASGRPVWTWTVRTDIDLAAAHRADVVPIFENVRP